MKTTLTESQVNELVERAVEYGVKKIGSKSALAINLGSIWLDGYMASAEGLTEDDKKSIRATIENYYFF